MLSYVGCDTIAENPFLAFLMARVSSAGLVAELTLAIKKARKGFSAIASQPTYDNILTSANS